jgi:hypothetical protein
MEMRKSFVFMGQVLIRMFKVKIKFLGIAYIPPPASMGGIITNLPLQNRNLILFNI